MATKQQKETQSQVNAIEAAIAANFENKTADSFTSTDQMRAALTAVNKPLIALLLGIAPNRKGELKASRYNPRVNGAQALELSARYSIIPALVEEVNRNNGANAAKAKSDSQNGMPADPNMAQQVIEVNGKKQFNISQADGKTGLEKFYGSLDFSQITLSPETINQLYEMGETVLVKDPNAKAKKVWMWVGIAAGAAVGGLFIYKLVTSSEDRRNGVVAIEKTDIDVDDVPQVEIEEVDIGNPTHEDILGSSFISDYR